MMTEHIEVVFVHLNSKVPKYLQANLDRFIKLFPLYKVTLILSDSIAQHTKYDKINIYRYQNRKNDILFKDFKHESKFRNNFWRASIERILAVCDYHSENPKNSILHFESDILIFPNFPFQYFSSLNRLTWQNYNHERDVGSIIYIPNSNISRDLHECISLLIQNNGATTDMLALHEARSNNLLEVNLLPSVPIGINLLDNWRYSANLDRDYFLPNSPIGIFDSAQFGMWFLGMDPRNSYGYTKLHSRLVIDNGEAPFDPSKAKYFLDLKDNLFIELPNQEKIPIFSLHAHSKKIELFNFGKSTSLERYVRLSYNSLAINKLDLKIFFKLLADSILTKRFLKFIIGMPYLYNKLMKLRKSEVFQRMRNIFISK